MHFYDLRTAPQTFLPEAVLPEQYFSPPASALFLEQEKILALVEGLTASISFYFDVGTYEPQFIPAHKQLVPFLEVKGCPCFFQELAGGHNWTSWRAHLKDLFTFLWKREGEGITGGTPESKPAGSRRRKR